MVEPDSGGGPIHPDEAVEPEVMPPGDPVAVEPAAEVDEKSVEEPAKVMRVGTMMRQLLEEVRAATLDEASRARLREIFEVSVAELGTALSSDLREELGRLVQPFEAGQAPSSDELRIAQAQLVGWLEGLIQGIQATLFAQQMAAQQQLAGMRRAEIGPGGRGAAPPPQAPDARHGTYL